MAKVLTSPRDSRGRKVWAPRPGVRARPVGERLAAFQSNGAFQRIEERGFQTYNFTLWVPIPQAPVVG